MTLETLLWGGISQQEARGNVFTDVGCGVRVGGECVGHAIRWWLHGSTGTKSAEVHPAAHSLFALLSSVNDVPKLMTVIPGQV